MRNTPQEEPPVRDGGGGVQSVDRALTILEVLARVGEAGVTEVAAELGVHKSTAFRLVATLETHRLVEQTEDRGKYRLGVGVLRLAGATTSRLDVAPASRSTPTPRRYLPRSSFCSTMPWDSSVATSRNAVLLWTPSSPAISVTPASPSRARMPKMVSARSTDRTDAGASLVPLAIP